MLLENLNKSSSIQFEDNNKTTIDLNIQKKKVKSEEKENIKTSKEQIKNISQTKPILSSIEKETFSENNNKVSTFEDLIKLSSIKKEIHLKYDLENNVNLIKFSKGKIDISFNENLDKNFVRNLSTKLLEWTGARWVITLAKEPGQKTFSETMNLRKKKMVEEEREKTDNNSW